MQYYCNACNESITSAEYDYSTRHFRIPLCRKHQEIARKNRNQPKVPNGTKRLDDLIFNSRVLNQSNSEISKNEMRLEVILTDPRAISIAESIPISSRNEIIEKYIILGEMVVSHANIATRKETVEDFFSPLKSDIDNIREQLRQIVPTIAKPANKGEITVDAIYRSFRQHFMDDVFEDVGQLRLRRIHPRQVERTQGIQIGSDPFA